MHFVFRWMGMHVLIISPVMGKRRSSLGELYHFFSSCADFPVHILVMCPRAFLVTLEFSQVAKYHSSPKSMQISHCCKNTIDVAVSNTQKYSKWIGFNQYIYQMYTHWHIHIFFMSPFPGLLLLLPDQKSRWEHYKSSCFGWYDSSGRNSSPDVCLGLFSDSTGDYQHDQWGEVFQNCGDQHLGLRRKKS